MFIHKVKVALYFILFKIRYEWYCDTIFIYVFIFILMNKYQQMPNHRRIKKRVANKQKMMIH